MRAKDLLIKRKNLEIALRLEEDRIRQITKDIQSLSAVDYGKDKIQTSNYVDISDLICQLEDYRDKRNKIWDELIATKIQIDAIMDKIEDPVLRAVLYYRYVSCFNWNTIAILVNNSISNVRIRLHTQALREFERFL